MRAAGRSAHRCPDHGLSQLSRNLVVTPPTRLPSRNLSATTVREAFREWPSAGSESERAAADDRVSKLTWLEALADDRERRAEVDAAGSAAGVADGHAVGQA